MQKINITRSAVCLLAGQLIRQGYEQASAMRTAWREIKGGELFILAAIKTNGQSYRRVVSTNLAAYMPPKTGTGRPAPEGLRLFIDWAKHLNGARSVISSYNAKLIAL